MHYTSANGNFLDEHGNAFKTEMLQDYSRHMGYINLGDRIIESNQVQQQT